MTDKSSGGPPARRRVSSFADDLAEDTKGQGGDDLDQPLNLSGFAPKTADELNTPLDALVANPVISDTEPPVPEAAAMFSPAFITTRPPAANLPVPTTTLMLPPAPDAFASPVRT